MQVLIVDEDLLAYIPRLHFYDCLGCECDVPVLIVGSRISSSRCNLILHSIVEYATLAIFLQSTTPTMLSSLKCLNPKANK
uniref:Uncharacterized protein n=1 Tax=Physcomitrium patens TaxID=3218 RepID=A0A2K1JWE0_PHYPA|nr:hypothetical protein PHYPA_015618 [Physcomitrium patens]